MSTQCPETQWCCSRALHTPPVPCPFFSGLPGPPQVCSPFTPPGSSLVGVHQLPGDMGGSNCVSPSAWPQRQCLDSMCWPNEAKSRTENIHSYCCIPPDYSQAASPHPCLCSALNPWPLSSIPYLVFGLVYSLDSICPCLFPLSYGFSVIERSWFWSFEDLV